MGHSYAAQYPTDASIPQDVVSFFEKFYELSDTPGIDEQYAAAFAPDATFILASKSAKGADAIAEVRRGMWTAVSARKHTVHQIYPFGKGALEFMLRGRVEYQLKSGGEAGKDWAGHAKLVKGADGGLRFGHYQVYLDTA